MMDEQPATAAQVQSAMDAFTTAARIHYGARLHDIVLFGSRPCGDASIESDADLAIILQDDGWDRWRERAVLSDLRYEPLIEFGLHIRAWPISLEAWNEPKLHRDPSFVNAVKRDARPLAELVSDYRKWREIFPAGDRSLSKI